jgi:acetylornithine deacetylase/succinyl-diaminopimelate desuccinylase-like protein
MESPNWPAAAAEMIRHLQALLRLDTTNPPGNETQAAEYLAGVLRAEGLEPLVLESAPGRGNLLLRLKGIGQEPPLLLFSHTDVVPAEPAMWQHPPFGGEVHDGFIWGRGTADMKGAVAQQLMVMVLLKRLGVPLRRDVVFAATADEEIGGTDGYGVSWLVRHHPDWLRAEFGLSEIGGYNIDLAGRRAYLVQVAEKGSCWLKVRARGRPGHGSMPNPDNAVLHLVRALNRLAHDGLPHHLTEPAADFLDAASQAASGTPLARLLRDLKLPVEAERAFLVDLEGHPMAAALYAMLHNTANPTGLNAGYKTNVIPGVAEATIDGRVLPGFDAEAFLGELKPVLGEQLEYEITLASPPAATSPDTALFRLIAGRLQARDPEAAVLPYLMPVATDAKYLVPLRVPTYGFTPIRLPEGWNYLDLFHTHDERVPVDGLAWGLEVLFDVVARYCTQAPGG